MAVTPQMLLLVCPLIFLAAFLDAIGGGGGLISLPAYYLAGLPPALAAGSNKFSATFGTLMATARFFKSGKLLVLPAVITVLGALPSAYLGAELLKRTDDAVVKIVMLIAIPLVCLLVVFMKRTNEKTREMTKKQYALCFPIGLACGFYDGFFGPGTGTILIALFSWILGMGMVTASATAKPVNLASNISALISLLRGGKVLFALAVPAMAFSMLGGFLGAKMAVKVGAKLVQSVMIAVMVMLLVKLAYDWLNAA